MKTNIGVQQFNYTLWLSKVDISNKRKHQLTDFFLNRSSDELKKIMWLECEARYICKEVRFKKEILYMLLTNINLASDNTKKIEYAAEKLISTKDDLMAEMCRLMINPNLIKCSYRKYIQLIEIYEKMPIHKKKDVSNIICKHGMLPSAYNKLMYLLNNIILLNKVDYRKTINALTSIYSKKQLSKEADCKYFFAIDTVIKKKNSKKLHLYVDLLLNDKLINKESKLYYAAIETLDNCSDNKEEELLNVFNNNNIMNQADKKINEQLSLISSFNEENIEETKKQYLNIAISKSKDLEYSKLKDQEEEQLQYKEKEQPKYIEEPLLKEKVKIKIKNLLKRTK